MVTIDDWADRQSTEKAHLGKYRADERHTTIVGDEIGARREASWGTGTGQRVRHRWKRATGRNGTSR